MSPSLQSEVAWECNSGWLQRVSFLKTLNQSAIDTRMFLVELAMRLTPKVFAPGEMAPVGRLYIVNRGLAVYAGRVLGVGKVWGEDVILASEKLRHQYVARALNFLEVLCVDRVELEAVASNFPNVKNHLRWFAVRLAVRRAFIQQARDILGSCRDDGTPRSAIDKMLRRASAMPTDYARSSEGATGALRMRRSQATYARYDPNDSGGGRGGHGAAVALEDISARISAIEVAVSSRSLARTLSVGQAAQHEGDGGEPPSPEPSIAEQLAELRAAQAKSTAAVAGLAEAVNALRQEMRDHAPKAIL
jgi:hypothetical protein